MYINNIHANATKCTAVHRRLKLASTFTSYLGLSFRFHSCFGCFASSCKICIRELCWLPEINQRHLGVLYSIYKEDKGIVYLLAVFG